MLISHPGPKNLAPVCRQAAAGEPSAGHPGRPLGDYETTDSVELHQLARELSPQLWSTLHRRKGEKLQLSSAGYQGPRSGFSDPNLVWLRDFSLMFVERDGMVEARKFLSLNPLRQRACSGQSVPVKPPSPEHIFVGKPGKGGGFVKLETVPLLVDGGDLVPAGETLIIGQRVLQRNAEEHGLSHLKEAGYRARSSEETLELLHHSTGADNIVVIPWWPGDKTGHADMPVQALGDGEVLVPEIRPQALQVLDYHHEREHGARVQSYLDQVAQQLTNSGLEVKRLPMMAPLHLTQGPHGWDGKSYTPANAYNGGNFVCLPTFDDSTFPAGYQQLKDGYEEEWKAFYQKRGQEVELLDATDLGKANGLFHCLTAGRPRLG